MSQQLVKTNGYLLRLMSTESCRDVLDIAHSFWYTLFVH
jgi:hypothetical protein